MKCPAPIAEIICEILTRGILRIRNTSDLALHTSEADHLHNLPALLSEYSPERLRYYWDAERPCFIARSRPGGLASFLPLWERLGRLVDELSAGTSGESCEAQVAGGR